MRNYRPLSTSLSKHLSLPKGPFSHSWGWGRNPPPPTSGLPHIQGRIQIARPPTEGIREFSKGSAKFYIIFKKGKKIHVPCEYVLLNLV